MVGLFDTNVVTEVFGSGTASDVVYVIVGIAGLAMLPRLFEDVAPRGPTARTRPASDDRLRPGRGCTPGRTVTRAARSGIFVAMPSGGGASLTAPVRYPSDSLTPAERARLAPHVTDLDGPVFALVNLPETVKGALFARYSRYPGTLRRLFLDEFADSRARGRRVRRDRGRARGQAVRAIFVGYGDDSVAQLGGAHVACEWVSNVLTKVLQRPRLGAYLEQSTRYIAYDAPMPGGGYRYYRDAELGPGVRGRDGLAVRHLRGRAPARARVGRRDVPARRRRARGRARPRGEREGARPPARPAARPRRSRTWASTRPARPTSS